MSAPSGLADARTNLNVSTPELIAVLAMLTATVAFATDAMLPAFAEIGADLSGDAPNRAQLVIATFMLGLGCGTFVTGPLSDAIGRQKVALGGSVLIVFFAMIGAFAQSLEVLLFARFLQGLGSAGPRVAAMAIVRDLFKGREMAKIMSFIIFVFTLAPIFAPSIGWVLMTAFGWRSIFVSFAIFAIISAGWLVLRLPETLTPDHKRVFRPAKLIEGLREIFAIRRVVLAMGAQTLVFSILMSTLMSSQQAFEQVFDQGKHFHLWFALMAALAAMANLINASLVMRLGMRAIVKWSLFVQGALTFVFLVLMVADVLPSAALFPFGVVWFTSVFYLAGFAIGNLTSIAMEPVGHMAGLAASIIAAVPTITSMAFAVPIGQAFNGTLIPLTGATFVLAALGLVLVHFIDDTGDMSDDNA